MIPVAVVTGFLGSGKTTFIGRVLRDSAFARTAVIINEFGEIPLDHSLIASSDESVLTLTTGCLCCAVQTDLARTLLDLLGRREAGLAAYDRVLIETSGLGDPGPMLQAMMSDQSVAETHQTAVVVTLVDTVLGEATLAAHAEARQQVALADILLFSKTDLQDPSVPLRETLSALNPSADQLGTTFANPAMLFAEGSATTLTKRLAAATAHVKRGHAEIETFVIERDRALPALALTMLLQAVAEHCGPRLLRMKGLVAVEEMPGQPAVIHGVQHIVTPPMFLGHWPDGDAETRIVFITKDVPRYFITRLLDAIEEDVRSALDDAT